MSDQKKDLWNTTTWAGNREDQLARAAAATPEERFRWLVETYELLAPTLPARKRQPLEGKL